MPLRSTLLNGSSHLSNHSFSAIIRKLSSFKLISGEFARWQAEVNEFLPFRPAGPRNRGSTPTRSSQDPTDLESDALCRRTQIERPMSPGENTSGRSTGMPYPHFLRYRMD